MPGLLVTGFSTLCLTSANFVRRLVVFSSSPFSPLFMPKITRGYTPFLFSFCCSFSVSQPVFALASPNPIFKAMFERKAEDAQHARESRVPSRKATAVAAGRGHDVTEAPAQRTLWRASSGTDLYNVKNTRARHVARAAVGAPSAVTAGGVGSGSEGDGGKSLSSGDCSDPAGEGKGGKEGFTHPLVESSCNEMSADGESGREGNSFDRSSLAGPGVGGCVGVGSLEGTSKIDIECEGGLPHSDSEDGANLRTAQDATNAAPAAVEKEDVSEQARDRSDEVGAGHVDISESRDYGPISSASRGCDNDENQSRESFEVLAEKKLGKEAVLAVVTAVVAAAVAADVEASSEDGESKEPEGTDVSGTVNATDPEKKPDEGGLVGGRRVTENDECSALGMETPESGMAPVMEWSVANKLDCKSNSGDVSSGSSSSSSGICSDSTKVLKGDGGSGDAARLSPSSSPSFAISPESGAPTRREGKSRDEEEGAEKSTSSGTSTDNGTSRKHDEGVLKGSGIVGPVDVECGDGDDGGVGDADGNNGQGVAGRDEAEGAVSVGGGGGDGGDRVTVAAEVSLATGDVRGVDQVEREKIEEVNGDGYFSRGVDDDGVSSPFLETTSIPAITAIDSPAAKAGGEKSQVILSSIEDLVRSQESFAAERVASEEARMPGGGSTLDERALPPLLLTLRDVVSVEEVVMTSASSSPAIMTAKETFGKLQEAFPSATDDERRISDEVPTSEAGKPALVLSQEAVGQALTAAADKDGDDKLQVVVRSPRSVEVLSSLTPLLSAAAMLKENERSLDVSIVDTPSTTGEAEEDARQHSLGSGNIAARRSFFDSAGVGAGTASGGSGGALYFASLSSSVAIDALERDDDKEGVDYDKEGFDDFGNENGDGDLVVSPPSPTGSPVPSRLQPVDEKEEKQEDNDKEKGSEASHLHQEQEQEKTSIATKSGDNTTVPPPYPENKTTTPRPRLRWPAAWSPTRVFSPRSSSRPAWPFSGGSSGGTTHAGDGGEGNGVGEGGLQVAKPCGSPRLRVPLSPGPKSEPLSLGQWPSSRSKVETTGAVNYFGEVK